MRAPEGSTYLDVRRSGPVAELARAKSVQVSTGTSGPMLVKAPPGMKPSAGYCYKVLLPVQEQGEKALELLGEPEDVSGKVGGSWDTTTFQAGSKALLAMKVGRKQAATSEAPGASKRAQIPQNRRAGACFMCGKMTWQ